MSIPLTSTTVTDLGTTDRQLIAELRRTLDANYGRLLENARKEWESRFAGNDPSDACVTVRITSDEVAPRQLPCTGPLEKPKASFLNGRRCAAAA